MAAPMASARHAGAQVTRDSRSGEQTHVAREHVTLEPDEGCMEHDG